MFNHGDYPHIGDIVKIDIIDISGFKNDVFGANKLLQLTEKQRSNNQLYGCMITMDMWDYFGTDDNENRTEIYLLDENNLIIHDTAFLSEEDLKYVRVELIDRPECINDFAKNIHVDQIRKGLKIRHANGVAYIADKTRTSICLQSQTDENDLRIFQLVNLRHMEQFHNEYHGFLIDDMEDVSIHSVGRRNTRNNSIESDPEEMAKWFDAIKILAAAGNERLRQMSRETEAEKRRSQFKVIEGGNDNL